jgi:hypothetical protein
MPPTALSVALEIERLESEILRKLAAGPVKSFGSARERNRILQRLRKQGRIEYLPIKSGGSGWQLVK